MGQLLRPSWFLHLALEFERMEKRKEKRKKKPDTDLFLVLDEKQLGRHYYTLHSGYYKFWTKTSGKVATAAVHVSFGSCRQNRNKTYGSGERQSNRQVLDAYADLNDSWEKKNGLTILFTGSWWCSACLRPDSRRFPAACGAWWASDRWLPRCSPCPSCCKPWKRGRVPAAWIQG